MGGRRTAIAWLAGALAAAAGCRQVLGIGGVTFTGAGGAGAGSSTLSSGSTGTAGASTGVGGGCSAAGQTRACYDGPPSTEGVGVCKGGTQTCEGGLWGACSDTPPEPENCASGKDQDCDGTATKCTGTPAWAEAFGSTDADFINAVAIDAKGDVVVTGGFSDTVDFAEPGAPPVTRTAFDDGNSDAFVAMYTGDGKLVWVDAFGGPGQDQGTGVAVDAKGDVIVAGSFATSATFVPGNTAAAVDVDAFVVKLSGKDGSAVWARTFGDTDPAQAASQAANAVAVDTSGGGDIAVVGSFAGGVDLGGGHTLSSSGTMDYDGFLVVLDPSGKDLWSLDVHGDPGPFPSGFDALKGVTFAGGGDVVVTGFVTGASVSFGGPTAVQAGGSGNHAAIARYSGTGNLRWGLALGSDGPQTAPRDVGYGVAAGASGDVVVTGSFAGSLQVPPEAALEASGAMDVFVAKLDPTGKALYSVRLGAAAGDVVMGNAVAVDQFGNAVVAGSYQGTLMVGTGAVTAQGTVDAFALKLGPMGGPIWVKGFASGMMSKAYASGVAVTWEPAYVQGTPPPGAALVAGQFGYLTGGTIDFGLASGPLTSAGFADMFLARLAP
jgi:hypothetical protein